MTLIKKRKRNWDNDDNYFGEMLGINKKPVKDGSSDVISCIAIVPAALISNKKERRKRVANLNRADQKYWWTQDYQNWNDEQLKLRLCVTGEILGLILNTVGPYITKQLTNFVPNPIEKHR